MPPHPNDSGALSPTDALPRWIPRSVLARPGRWLLGILIASIPFALALGRLEIRSDGESLHPDGNAVIRETLEDRERFSDPEALAVLIAPRRAEDDLFTPEGLVVLARLTERLRVVPGVRSDDLLSIATALDVTISTDAIRLTRFLDHLPETDAEARALRRRLDADGIYPGLLYGLDGRSALILVPLADSVPRAATTRRVRAVLTGLDGSAFHARLTGPVAAEVLLGEQILTDLKRLVPGVVLAVAVVLFLCLRSAGGALVPLAEMLLVLLWTFGTMAMLRVPLTIVTSVLPVLLMAMAVTDVLHLLERFQAHAGAGAARATAITRGLAEAGPAIARTSITTALGFLSFVSASVPPMRHFGLFAGLGIVLAMAFSFTLVPALSLVLPAAWVRRAGGATRRAPRGLEGWAGDHPRAAAVVAVGVVAIGLGGLGRLEIEDSWIGNFVPSSDLVAADSVLNREYHGGYRLDVVVGCERADFFRRTAGLWLLDSLQAELNGFPEVSATRSVVDLVRAARRGVEPAGNEDGRSLQRTSEPHSRLGPDRDLRGLDDAALAPLFLLIEMSGQQRRVDALVTPDARAARIQCFVRDADYALATRLGDRVAAMGARLGRSDGFRLRATGDLPVATQVVRATVSNQVRSIALTLLGLVVFLAISFRSIPTALALVAPVAATTLVVFGGMGYLGITLGVATTMFAALAAGEGVDFAIHIVSRHRHLMRTRPLAEALRETLASVGTAVRWNGAALVAGCLVLTFSAIRPVRALGALLAAGMVVSYAMSFLLLPAFLSRRPAGSPRDGVGEQPDPDAGRSAPAPGSIATGR